MNVVFRADASLSIGAGHLSRCLTLAESLKRRGADVTFVCAAGSCAFVPRVNEIADAVVELPHSAAEVDGSTNGSWLTVSPATDAEMTITALAGITVDWLVVDHYGIDATWESLLRPLVGKVMVIDDLANRKHDCDLLLDQNLRPEGAPAYADLVPKNCRILLGPRFALLREEFIEQARARQRERTSVRRVLVSFGGSDGVNATSMALDALGQLPSLAADVVVGVKHPHLDQIIGRCKTGGWTSHVQTTEMASLIARSDLAIGAAGASSWERCFLGLPSIVVAVAENQNLIAQNLGAAGAAVSIGSMSPETAGRIVAAARDLLDKPSSLARMAMAARAITMPHESIDRFILGS